MADPSGPTVSDQAGEAHPPIPSGPVPTGTGEPAAPADGGTAPVPNGSTGSVDATGTVAPDPESSAHPAEVAAPPAAPEADEPSPTVAESAQPADVTDGVADADPPADGGPTSVTTTAADGDAKDEHDELDEHDLEDEDDDDEAPAKRTNPLTRQIQIEPRTVVIIIAVLAVCAGAYYLGQKQARDVASPTATTASSTPPTTAFTLPKDFLPFDDKETGIKLAVPKDWVAYSTRDLDRSYRLLIGVPEAKDNLRVRMNAYSTAVTKDNIKDQQAVVDSIFAQEKIEILARETPTVNGMPALYYVYKFTDAQGAPGFHAHFFVFQGKKMVSLVFEAVPEDRFTVLAPVFDQIANSLEVAPGEPPAFLVEATGSGAAGPATTAAPAPTPPSSTP